MDFPVRVDHRVKIKENQKRDKYLDFASKIIVSKLNKDSCWLLFIVWTYCPDKGQKYVKTFPGLHTKFGRSTWNHLTIYRQQTNKFFLIININFSTIILLVLFLLFCIGGYLFILCYFWL